MNAAAELVQTAKDQGLALTGPNGLLKQLTKTVIEKALNEEMTEHLGHEKNDPAGCESGNILNGTRKKHSSPILLGRLVLTCHITVRERVNR